MKLIVVLLNLMIVVAWCRNLIRYDYAPAEQVAHYALQYERDLRPVWKAAQLQGAERSEGYSEEWFSVPSVMQDSDSNVEVPQEQKPGDSEFAFDQSNLFESLLALFREP